MAIEIKGLSFSYGRHQVLQNVTFSVEKGQLAFLLGQNGAGKSTIFRCCMDLLSDFYGEIYLNSKSVKSMSRREIAKKVAYIPQSAGSNFDFAVLDVVLMGMAGSLSALEIPQPRHEKIALEALERLSIGHLASRGFGHISGGERQLALLARALVQGAKILLLDEPTANLDFGNQHRILQLLRSLSRQGYTVLLSSHDPNQTLQYGDVAVVLEGGSVSTSGAPAQVLTAPVLSRLYGLSIGLQGGHCVVEG